MSAWASGVPSPPPASPRLCEGQLRPPGVLGGAGSSEAQAKGCVGSLSANGRPTGSPEPGEDRVHAGTGDPREPQCRVRESEPCPAASGPRRACLAAVPPASCQLCRPGHGSVPPTPPRPCVPTQGWGQEAHMGLGPGQLGQCQACPDHCDWWAVGTVGTPGPALGRRCTPRLSTGPGGPRGSSHRDRGWAGEGRSHVLPPGCRDLPAAPAHPSLG